MMIKIVEKSVRAVSMSATCPTHSRTELSVRDVKMVIDEPLARGGTNAGFSPTETMLASLAGCTNVIVNSIAEKMDVLLKVESIDMEYDFEFLGARLKEEVDLPFPEVRMTINVKTVATEDQLDLIKQDLEKYCPVAKMFRNAGSRIVEKWNILPENG